MDRTCHGRGLLVGVALAGLVVAMVGCSGDDDDARSPTTAVDTGVRPLVPDGSLITDFVYDKKSQVAVALVITPTAGSTSVVFDVTPWVFDVTATSWSPKAPVRLDSDPRQAVYDPATDLIVTMPGQAMEGGRATYAYDVDRDVWSRRANVTTLPARSADLDGGTGDVVAMGLVCPPTRACLDPSLLDAAAYDVDADQWDDLSLQQPVPPDDSAPLLTAYVPTIDKFVTYIGTTHPTTSTYAAETNTWATVDTDTPVLFTSMATGTGNAIVYSPVTDRVIVFNRGVTAEYDPATSTWTTYDAPATTTKSGQATTLLHRLGADLVYDTVNKRVLMYGGWFESPTVTGYGNDLWAYDPVTHAWSQVLDATNTTLTTS